MDVRELLADRYELRGLLGRGGMAEVRKGKDQRLGRTVAVKRLRTDLASDATFQARFRREAQNAFGDPTVFCERYLVNLTLCPERWRATFPL